MGKVASAALKYAISKIGCRYSQPERMKEDVYDCSSLIFRAFHSAGYNMETNPSNEEVYDKGFDLIWPENYSMLGKKFTSIAKLQISGYVPMPGDIVFYQSLENTNRKNKITHVAFVEGTKGVVHARGIRFGVLRNNFNDMAYRDKVVAITRFKEPQDTKPEPVKKRLLKLTDPMMRGDDIKQVQEKLKKLNYIISTDGIFGSKTEQVIEAFQRSKKLTPDGIVGDKTYQVLGL